MEKGGQWTIPSTTGENQNQNVPRIAGTNDTLGVVWHESNNSFDIGFSFSVSDAQGLTTNTITLDGNDGSQKNPDIVFRDGVFHIVYTDLELDQLIYRQVSFSPFASLGHLIIIEPFI